jgi:hypothetical protein
VTFTCTTVFPNGSLSSQGPGLLGSSSQSGRLGFEGLLLQLPGNWQGSSAEGLLGDQPCAVFGLLLGGLQNPRPRLDAPSPSEGLLGPSGSSGEGSSRRPLLKVHLAFGVGPLVGPSSGAFACAWTSAAAPAVTCLAKYCQMRLVNLRAQGFTPLPPQ